jgi:hypothetical protein
MKKCGFEKLGYGSTAQFKIENSKLEIGTRSEIANPRAAKTLQPDSLRPSA